MGFDVIYVKAKLTLYTAQAGGRQNSIVTGYRPNHVFDYKEDEFDFVATYIGQIEFEKEEIVPGEIAKVDVMFLKSLSVEKFLKIGRIWWIHDGPDKVGEAEVLEIIDNL